ncbi:MAG: hypothetical protein IPN38_19000, partial [Flavobacteriales bacterium]|nr:hypothetical protein [Flavobacteriales bacterium]
MSYPIVGIAAAQAQTYCDLLTEQTSGGAWMERVKRTDQVYLQPALPGALRPAP